MSALTPDLYAYFNGHWTFARTMFGADDILIGAADGVAEFVPAENSSSLHYKESGQLRLSADQRVVAFSRRFHYDIAGNMVRVAFADGIQAGQAYQSYRYDPTQRALLPMQTHLCIMDRYDGSYRLIDADHFDLYTRIEGPHKDYLLHTRFTRCAG
ncbi:DUF6314 family protein [Herbaspirillum sp. RV1423]|uniref:DUF6314 family protein n=1 Tax=Herbaspirillum sp. RV1423 TaxID=1443993 RepID=UPI000556ED92|nr:DUF6314 family protein [Herbaspirillum sp. RV1423]